MKKTLSIILAILMIVTTVPFAFAAEGEATTVDLTSLTGTYVIRDSGEYTFTGSGNYGIKVESGNPMIILNDASITVGEEWDYENIVNAIDIVAANSETTVWVMGTNNLTSNSGAGIYVKSGSTVIIKSDSRDNVLTAQAGMDGAGIGGTGYDFSYENVTCGNIYIENVTVNAYSSGYMSSNPGIGAFASCGTITIKNATVTALGSNQGGVLYGGEFCSAIGASSVPDIVIENSTINAYLGDSKDGGTGSQADWIGAVIIYDPYSGDTPHTSGVQCGNGYIKNTTVNKFMYDYKQTTEEGSLRYGALGGLLKEDGTCEGGCAGGTATCMGYKCDNCGAWYGEKNDTHDWSNKDGICANGCGLTCDHESYTEGVCDVCGYACAHTTEKDENKATCQLGDICDLCGTEYGDINADNHKDTLVQVEAKAPTCTEIGWDAYEYCTACTYTTYVELPVDPDAHTPLEAVKENEVAPKCDVTGSYDLVVYCDDCGAELDRDTKTVDALKHSFTKYEVTEEAKCGVAGKEVATCDNGCGETDEKAIEALTHTDADGDYICDHGCGYEYEKPAPEDPTPDTPDEPEDETCADCGKVHTNFFSEIICFFTRIINFIKNLFA